MQCGGSQRAPLTQQSLESPIASRRPRARTRGYDRRSQRLLAGTRDRPSCAAVHLRNFRTCRHSAAPPTYCGGTASDFRSQTVPGRTRYDQNLASGHHGPCDDDGRCRRPNVILHHDINPDDSANSCSGVWRLQLQQQSTDHRQQWCPDRQDPDLHERHHHDAVRHDVDNPEDDRYDNHPIAAVIGAPSSSSCPTSISADRLMRVIRSELARSPARTPGSETMTNTASRFSPVVGLAMIAGTAVLAGCSSSPPAVTRTSTSEQTTTTTPPPLVSTTTTTQHISQP